jgi:parallel beta-helix repeat protein
MKYLFPIFLGMVWSACTMGSSPAPDWLAAHLPADAVLDGSTSYQSALQQALDASPEGATLVFPPAIFLLDDAKGLRVPSNRALVLDGATFLLSPALAEDGQALLLENTSNVAVRGGTIQGHRDTWAESVNLAGIRVTGSGSHIRVSETRFIDLSSVGVGIYGASPESPIRNVWIENIDARNCCNVYYDYLTEKRGPAEGSAREDQGSICFYHVEDFVVRGCYLDGSRSDGTHFMGCRNGQIADNQILNSTMGGFFLEGCTRVVATDNIMRKNGSRGCTIERDSVDCILSNNIVEHSGREGLWAPDVARIVVSNNIFRENGQKDDADKDSEIRINDEARYTTVPADILIQGNIFEPTAHSNSVIQVNAGVGTGIVIAGNTFTGPVRTIAIDEGVVVAVDGNAGLVTSE